MNDFSKKKLMINSSIIMIIDLRISDAYHKMKSTYKIVPTQKVKIINIFVIYSVKDQFIWTS